MKATRNWELAMIRAKLGKRQKDIAKEAGMHLQTIHYLETKHHMPQARHIAGIALAYGLTAAELRLSIQNARRQANEHAT